MINENHQLLLELWGRIKSHIAPKERLEVADILVAVFDEFSLVEDELLDEDLDKELRAAVRSNLAIPEDNEEEGDDYDSF